IGTIAGNLMLKHEHREFDSDMFLLLETVGASLIIKADKGSDVTMSPAEFLDYDMNKKVLYQIVVPPYDNTYVFKTYKIMPRAQNVHAIVNAGFLFSLDGKGTVVNKPNIIYGGINPKFVSTIQHSSVKT
ncbi:unnamed protein product, partial [Timema podura]|nr:unnamed protein product [Timema podura]